MNRNNKRYFLAAILSLAIFATACGSGGGSTKTQLKGEVENYKTEGWLDDNTFQVKALGAPNPSAKGFVRRRSQSKDAAIIMAQKRITELMIGAKVEGACGVDSGESTGCAVTKEFGSNIKGGAIIKTSYDGDDNCEIVYRIHSKGLKKAAETEISRLSNQ